jgi:FKBP-type peptidyl-prolyl cis-trans isomerase 2
MKDGDFVLINYVGRVAETNEIFDLTEEETAKKENVFNKNQTYRPVFVIIGAYMIIPGVEKHLKDMQPGQELTFIVKPEEAFGKRDIKLIKIFPLSKFLEQKIDPRPGDYVQINGIQAKISSVSGGRVRVDFNHPLAGKELKYTVKIVKKITDPNEKVKAILERYDIKANIQLKDGKLILKMKQKPNPAIEKLVKDLMEKWIKEIKAVKFEISKVENKV